MARPALSRPTDGDIEILNVLWKHGPLGIRGIHEGLNGRQGYNSTLKRVQIMEEKGYLIRKDGRPATYEPAPEKPTKISLVQDLVRRVFGGSSSSLVLHVLDSKVSPTELKAIKDALARSPAKRGAKR